MIRRGQLAFVGWPSSMNAIMLRYPLSIIPYSVTLLVVGFSVIVTLFAPSNTPPGRDRINGSLSLPFAALSPSAALQSFPCTIQRQTFVTGHRDAPIASFGAHSHSIIALAIFFPSTPLKAQLAPRASYIRSPSPAATLYEV